MQGQWRARQALALGLTSVGWGCTDTVALGSECPRFGEACLGVDPGSATASGASDAGSVLDAAAPDAAPRDAGATPLGIENPSFELTRGDGGEVTGLSDDAIEPWYTCRTGLDALHEADVRAEPTGEPTPEQRVEPRDGETFVSMRVPFGVGSGPGLFQRLASPLGQGRRYAFVVDARSATSDRDDLALHVWGARAGCLPTVHLFASEPLRDADGWTAVCVHFELESDVEEIVLEARSGTVLGAASRLFLDDIRRSPDCQ